MRSKLLLVGLLMLTIGILPPTHPAAGLPSKRPTAQPIPVVIPTSPAVVSPPPVPQPASVQHVEIVGKSYAESVPVQTPPPAAPAPPPVAPPAPAPAPVGCEYYRALVAQYTWNVDVAMKVMEAESGCNPSARNPEGHYDALGNLICSGSYGLFQISCHGGQLYDATANVAAAWAKYKDSGWKPWGVCNRGIVICY